MDREIPGVLVIHPNAAPMPDSFVGRLFSAKLPMATESNDPQPSADDRYALHGSFGLIAGDLKSFAFAKARALRWSADLLDKVTIVRYVGDSIGMTVIEESVDARTMSPAEFEIALLEAECARLEDCVTELRSVEMDVRATREDAEESLAAIKMLAGTVSVPMAPTIEAARSAAQAYECLGWYVLTEESDDAMLSEYSDAYDAPDDGA